MAQEQRFIKPTVSVGPVPATPSAAPLSEEDVRRLLSDESKEARYDVSRRLAESYAGGSFNPREATIAEQIFRLLLGSTEVSLRTLLAEQLKESSGLPRDIALSMARDVEDSVALPVLRYSIALNEQDLLEIIATTKQVTRQVAIGERSDVPPTIVQELLRTGKAEVARALASNPGAALDEDQLRALQSTFKNDAALLKVVNDRLPLSAAVTEKVAHLVTGQLADMLRKKYHLAEDSLQEEAQRVRLRATLGALRRNPTTREVEKLLVQLVRDQRVSAEIMVAALAEGHTNFFVSALARLANVQTENAHALVFDRGDLGFRALYNKSSLPSPLFAVVRQLLALVQEELARGKEKPGSAFSARIRTRLRAEGGNDSALPNLLGWLATAAGELP